jgi:hypothetical protein
MSVGKLAGKRKEDAGIRAWGKRAMVVGKKMAATLKGATTSKAGASFRCFIKSYLYAPPRVASKVGTSSKLLVCLRLAPLRLSRRL